MKTEETVNQLKHVITKSNFRGTDLIIKIRLSDDCKNGHNDFAITADIYTAGKRGDCNMLMGGCCHDEIIKAIPSLKMFVDLHLANVNGSPTYAIANGFYILKSEGIVKGADYLRVTIGEAEQLNAAEDELYFTYLLNELGIPAKWKQDAKIAIKKLEEMTGEKFEDNSTKLEPLTLSAEDELLVKTRISAGYYKPEAIEARKLQAIEDAKNKALKDIEDDFNKSVEKERMEYLVKKAVLLGGLDTDNFIYYNHTNEGVFNWNTSSYCKAITHDQFLGFMDWLKLSDVELPKGIIFKLGK